MEVDALLAKVSTLKDARSDGDEAGDRFAGFTLRLYPILQNGILS